MALSASCVLRSFSRMKACFTVMALSNAARAVTSCPWVRASALLTCSNCAAKLPAISSRLAWMAAFTLAVRSATSFLYLASSRSSKGTLALTMAILSFMRGTWSFMSRMFCSRMSSGSSATEMKKPMNERITLLKRLHIKAPFALRPFSRFRRSIRCADDGAGCNRILADEIAYGISNLFFFLLLFQPPAEEFFFCLGHIVIVLLHFGALLGDQAIHVCLNLTVLFGLARLQIIERTLLDALVPIERTVTTDRILNYVFDVDAGGVQSYQHRGTLDV